MLEANYKVTARVDGKDLGIWDKFTGGEIDSDEVRYKPGAMGVPISLGGMINIANVVIVRMFDLQRDQAVIHWLIGRVGKGQIVINKQPLDPDGNAYGRPLVYQGKIKKVTPPPHDSESANVALVEIEMVPAGTVA